MLLQAGRQAGGRVALQSDSFPARGAQAELLGPGLLPSPPAMRMILPLARPPRAPARPAAGVLLNRLLANWIITFLLFAVLVSSESSFLQRA